MVQYDRKVLNHLLDTYENSLLSTGENKRTIQIEFRFTKTAIPSYYDESSDEYERIHPMMRWVQPTAYRIMRSANYASGIKHGQEKAWRIKSLCHLV